MIATSQWGSKHPHSLVEIFFFIRTILSSISSFTAGASRCGGAAVLVEWLCPGHYFYLMLQTMIGYQLQVCVEFFCDQVSWMYKNCNFIENFINKVLDVKPLVPFIITEYANSLTNRWRPLCNANPHFCMKVCLQIEA